jgi:tight adherence protein C
MRTLFHRRRVRLRIVHDAGAIKPSFVRRGGRLTARFSPARRWADGYEQADPALLLGRCTAGAIVAAALLAASGTGARAVAAIPLGALIGWRAALAFHQRSARAGIAGLRRELPFALDRMSTCLLAGMSVERALRLVAPGTPGLLGSAFSDGLAALDVGMTRAQAYRRIADRAGTEEVRRLMSALARAERFGTSLSETLVAYAAELRSHARAGAEAEARTAPVKLIFPLVFCFLPAFVVLTIAPIAISAVRTLSTA